MIVRLSVLVALLAVLTACYELECDDAEVASVTVSVWASDGLSGESDYATYSVEGSLEYDCEPLDGQGHEYLCGLEENGWFTIFVYAGGAVYTAEVDVGMNFDGCHPAPEWIDVYLD